MKKIVLNIGPLSRFDDGRPDYLERLKLSFRNGKPLIAELQPYAGETKTTEYVIKYKDGDLECIGKPKLLATCILDPFFAALGLDALFASIKFAGKMEYDLAGIVRLLVFGRLLNPASKMATMNQNQKFLRPPVRESNSFNVYDALSVVNSNAVKIFGRMNTCIKTAIGRDTEVMFYDVTNFFFETNEADPDILDESGEIKEKGLRKFGPSKENRKQPIVQVGLFMDGNGIPVSFAIFPGNTLDHNTLRPAMQKTVDDFKLARFILVADRGMYSGTNMCHVLDSNNGYIVSKSLRKSTASEREWAVSLDGYTIVSENFRYKSREVTRKTVDANGNMRTYTEKVVVYWSKNFYDREFNEHKSFLEFVEKLKANPAGFRVTTAQSRSLGRFLKKDVIDKRSGEILDGTKLVAMIDDDKLNEFCELMGYYQISTSELTMPDLEIIKKYHGLTQIEDQFREMKGTIDLRPVFVRTKEHICAHVMICFIALTIMRLIQRKIEENMDKDNGDERYWSYGISGKRLSNALISWQALRHPGDVYQILDSSNGDLQNILSAVGVELKQKIYTKGEIAKIKSNVRPF